MWSSRQDAKTTDTSHLRVNGNEGRGGKGGSRPPVMVVFFWSYKTVMLNPHFYQREFAFGRLQKMEPSFFE